MAPFDLPVQPVDATLHLRQKVVVDSVLSKRTDLSVSSQAHLNKALRQLNERRRTTLGFETPAARFNASVASTRKSTTQMGTFGPSIVRPEAKRSNTSSVLI